MKKLFLVPMLIALLASCAKENSLPTATSAATKMYEQYAEREGLTVALLGNYQKGGETYNALMLQAQNDQVWDSLLNEFGPSFIGSGEEISSVEISYLHSDTITGEMDDFFAAIADSLSQSLPVADQNYSVTVSKTYEDGALVDESSTVLAGHDVDTMRHRDFDEAAIEDGKVGYVVHIESSQRAVWILFYSNRSEYDAIINNINN